MSKTRKPVQLGDPSVDEGNVAIQWNSGPLDVIRDSDIPEKSPKINVNRIKTSNALDGDKHGPKAGPTKRAGSFRNKVFCCLLQ
ncbi:hypothetical protein BIW11_14169 [Tropilaelaps mercedesae]|uniref:Uncharacterized protein n=1 Tax=Tropilaelaps mercedesae TaxID=418985 RepID=A0A1V9WZ05_9ACAR|nr:hypothetical protein BIW11_14169 [Tropilaelaps mercedesae]